MQSNNDTNENKKPVTLDDLADMVANGFAETDKKLEHLEIKFDSKISLLPTKSYIDEKFANLEGDLVVKLRKEDQKINRLLEMMQQKKLLSDSDIQELANFQIFPRQSELPKTSS